MPVLDPKSVDYRSNYEFTKDIPYLTLMGKPYRVFLMNMLGKILFCKIICFMLVIERFNWIYYIIFSPSDYGDKDNADLGERFEAKKEDFPVYKLFKKGLSLDEPISFHGNNGDADEIQRFIIQNTGQFDSSCSGKRIFQISIMPADDLAD